MTWWTPDEPIEQSAGRIEWHRIFGVVVRLGGGPLAAQLARRDGVDGPEHVAIKPVLNLSR